MRIVLDTNVYIAAAINIRGFSEEILQRITKSNSFVLITSEEILLEIERKLTVKFHWSEEDVNRFTARIRRYAETIEITEKISVVTRDPEDNKILECALAGNADLIVTLDQDLIKLKSFKGIAIIHPKTLTWTFPEDFKKDS